MPICFLFLVSWFWLLGSRFLFLVSVSPFSILVSGAWFLVSGFLGFRVSGFLGFWVSGFLGFWVSGFLGFSSLVSGVMFLDSAF